ncbi:pyridoxamine 5'-phosphate oxidase [Brachybacterium sp. EF45031]|uniref:pyridoxamine 5'-phosphate oxidase n=1 Tax=Brachybacterium sillae TaxID=2810536 RepID=UPI00217D2AAA|nr:pyridoxamine 5'-phosphate oxidase [Brachybacterium sillae]MCS6711752.1 pyridoxamine 5'-phosphate oxidase [Brachybacterium sillae]
MTPTSDQTPPSPAAHPRAGDAHTRLASERMDYRAGTLGDDVPADPLELFGRWLSEAFDRRDSEGDLPEPTAVVLSTIELPTGDASADGGHPSARPRSRTVLLKEHDERGFVIYTNGDSAKGQEMSGTPWAAMLFPWYALQRQVRVEGFVQRVDDAEADEYFASRPRGSQLGARASHQSRPIASREALDAQYAQVEREFEGREVPRPEHWGGFRLVPDRIEFWQGRSGRMHDRIVYTSEGSGSWTHERLQP